MVAVIGIELSTSTSVVGFVCLFVCLSVQTRLILRPTF